MGAIVRGKLARGEIALWDGVNRTYTRNNASGGNVEQLSVGEEVDVLQVYGGGTARTSTTLLSAKTSIAANECTITLATGTWTISENVTLPSTMRVRIPAGCVLAISSGITLTISGPLYVDNPAGTFKSGSGTLSASNAAGNVYITAAEIAAGVTPVNYFEEPGLLDRYATNTTPGTTDMTAAWVAANAQSAQGGAPIKLRRSSGTYAFASAISTSYLSSIDAEIGSAITYTGSGEIAFLTIGDSTHTAQFRTYKLPQVTRASQADWTNEANIGVKFFSCSDCRIESSYIAKFTICMQTLPTGGLAFAHNDIFVGTIANGKIQLDISNATSGASNENNWYQGRFTMFGNPNSTLAAYGVRITSSDASYVTNNNNVFYKPSFEIGAASASAERVPILMTHGVQNHFINCRNEDNDTPFVREENASSENTYELGYYDSQGLPSIECTSSSPLYSLKSARTRAFDNPGRLIFESGPLHKRTCYYDGGTNMHVGGVGIARASDATIYTNHANMNLTSTYVEFTASGAGVAIFVDTSVVKQFLVTKDVEAGYGGRVIVNAYDSGAAITTTAGSVKGTLAQSFSSTTDYGGAFTIGSDSDDNTFFTVATAVKSIRIVIAESTANLRIRSFAIYGVNSYAHAASWTGYEEMQPGSNIGTAAPTAGTWSVGKIVWKADVAAGGSPGWICTTAGTPGTWKAMAAVAA